MFLPEMCKIVPVMRPIDSTGSGFTAEWISMKNYKKATFVVNVGVIQAPLIRLLKLRLGMINLERIALRFQARVPPVR